LFTATANQQYPWFSGDSDGGWWESWSTSASGIFLFDGSYRFNGSAASVHALSNDPRMLLGSGYRVSQLWSDNIAVPFGWFFPHPGRHGRARRMDFLGNHPGQPPQPVPPRSG
jgi:hypothetical protein